MGGRLPLGHREVPYVLADGRLQLSLSVGVPHNDLRKCLPPTPPFLNPIGAVSVATGALLPLLPAPLSLCPYLLLLLFLIPSMVYRQKKDHDASQKGRLIHSDHVGHKRTRLLEHVLLMRDFQRYFQPIFNPISAPYVFEDSCLTPQNLLLGLFNRASAQFQLYFSPISARFQPTASSTQLRLNFNST